MAAIENKPITPKQDDLQACINKLNNIIDKLNDKVDKLNDKVDKLNNKVVSYSLQLASYSSQHPYSYNLSQRSEAKEDTADPAEEALKKVKEED